MDPYPYPYPYPYSYPYPYPLYVSILHAGAAHEGMPARIRMAAVAGTVPMGRCTA
jgi:hypothetical protein